MIKFEDFHFGRLYVTKEIIKPCGSALQFLRNQVDATAMAYDQETKGVEIVGSSHLFDRVPRDQEKIPWYYPVVMKNPEGRGLVVTGLVKTEYDFT